MENFRLSRKNLIGHASTMNYLQKNIAEQKFPHAVIFSGAEGIGKRLAAEICAAASSSGEVSTFWKILD